MTIFRRLVARRAGLRSPADAGLLGVEYRVAVTPSLSALFQGFPNFSKEIPRKFQGNSKLFQGFPNFFLGRFEGNQGVVGRSSRNPVFSNFCVVSAATGGPAIRRRTRSRFNIARSPIIGKKLSAAISLGGLGASAAADAPTRKPTAATPAPCNFDRERRRALKANAKHSVDGSLFFPKPKGCQGRAHSPSKDGRLSTPYARAASSGRRPLTASKLRKFMLP